MDKCEGVDKYIVKHATSEIYFLSFYKSAREEDHEKWHRILGMFLGMLSDARKISSPNGGHQMFVFIDQDLVRTGPPKTNKITISHYRNGKLITNDLIGDIERDASLNVATSSLIEWKEKPIKRCDLEVRCPGSQPGGQCSAQDKKWLCVTCKELLEYGLDDKFVYCSCGGAPVETYTFKCNEHKHGHQYANFERGLLMPLLDKLRPFKEINILILGETGTGKSTWINAFANCLTHTKLDDAVANPVYLIPTSFTITDDNYKKVTITVESTFGAAAEANEWTIVGQSATQFPKAYIFRKGDSLVRIIDTPGIGDTRGASMDKANFQNVLSYLSHLSELHGICILLKPNEARLTVMLQYCIKGLLLHLHKDACQNILFVLTNSRATLYRPGNTYAQLEILLGGIPQNGIVLAKPTVYCVDNEAVRYMACVQHGMTFTDTDKKCYEASWEKTVEEMERMFQHILSRPPHALRNTHSLNNARRLILAFTEPLAKISESILANVRLAEDKENEIRLSLNDKRSLEGKLYVSVLTVKSKPLPRPRTVCTASKCISVVNGVTNFKTWCHEACDLENVVPGRYPNPDLKRCSAMLPSKGEECAHCGCSWDKHVHVMLDYYEAHDKIVDKSTQELLRQKNGDIDAATAFLDKLAKRKDGLNKEMSTITSVVSHFGSFLKQNAIVPYNDAMEDYLNYAILEEQNKIPLGASDAVKKNLEVMLSKYRIERKILDDAMAKGSKVEMSPQDIEKMVQTLYALPIKGAEIRSAVENSKNAQEHSVLRQEFAFTPSSKQSNSGFAKWTKNKLQELFKHGESPSTTYPTNSAV
ncbi:uncharacterized protein LOC129583006 [Paramacrobiotus metropolitanus]|uniref:uncharacterized protein LOC129583006 n=1 Tax=Paramacrobiotus metropolitanus TaxID=2943436 RepID=UPI0024463155|nr:uncharacterized protein LOC129583006 [Paramacrobiotus metropolitanus]